MKEPKEFTEFEDVPAIFREAISERKGIDLETIKRMSRQDIVKEKVAWEMGDPEWYSEFEYWLNAAGLKIVKEEI